MAKQSGYLKRQKARDDVLERAYKQTYQQYMTDMFIIALNDPAVMGKDVLGYKRLLCQGEDGRHHAEYLPAGEVYPLREAV